MHILVVLLPHLVLGVSLPVEYLKPAFIPPFLVLFREEESTLELNQGSCRCCKADGSDLFTEPEA